MYYSVPNIVGRQGQVMKVCPKFENDEEILLENSKKSIKRYNK